VAPPCANASQLKQAINKPTATELRMLNMSSTSSELLEESQYIPNDGQRRFNFLLGKIGQRTIQKRQRPPYYLPSGI
jgi:hypothetical protein